MPFTFQTTCIEGVFLIESLCFGDERGFFMETYKASEFSKHGIRYDFVQDNHSKSTYGVLRGLHCQNTPHAQGKLVRCTKGAVWDVAVDLRMASSTYLQWFGTELSEDNRIMMYIPPHFAHGFVTLSKTAQFQYKCTAEYNKDAEIGIRWDDPFLNIQWPVSKDDILVSNRDRQLPALREMGWSGF